MPALRLLICLTLLAASSSSSCPGGHGGGPQGECVASDAGAGVGELEEREDESLLALHHSRSERTARSGGVESVEADIRHPAPQAQQQEAQQRARRSSFQAPHPAAPGLSQAQTNTSWPGHGSPSGGYPDYPGYGQGQQGDSHGNSPWQSGGYQGYYPGQTGGSHGNAPWQSGGYQGYYPGNDNGQSGGHSGNGPWWQPGGNQDHYSGGGPGQSGAGGQDYGNGNQGSGYSNYGSGYGGYYPEQEQQHLCDGGFSGTVARRRRMGRMCSCRRRQSTEGVEQATDGSNYGWACKNEEMVAAKLQYTEHLGSHFGKSKSCSNHPACSRFEGDCCPTEDNVMLECCEV